MWSQGTELNGRFRLVARIGAGPMGDVWRAEDLVLGQPVAVRILPPTLLEDPAFAERFQTEARTLAALSHPGVIAVYDHGRTTEPSAAFLVMEFIDGFPLKTLLARDGCLDPTRTLDVVAQTLEALQAAHDRGLVHRAVRPANVLLRGTSVVVTDFGMVRTADARGLTVESDLYAVGMIAYECLTGAPLSDGDGSADVPPLPDRIPSAVQDLVLRALARDPAERFPSASAMAEAARSAALEPDPASQADAAGANWASSEIKLEPVVIRLEPVARNVAAPEAIEAVEELEELLEEPQEPEEPQQPEERQEPEEPQIPAQPSAALVRLPPRAIEPARTEAHRRRITVVLVSVSAAVLLGTVIAVSASEPSVHPAAAKAAVQITATGRNSSFTATDTASAASIAGLVPTSAPASLTTPATPSSSPTGTTAALTSASDTSRTPAGPVSTNPGTRTTSRPPASTTPPKPSTTTTSKPAPPPSTSKPAATTSPAVPHQPDQITNAGDGYVVDVASGGSTDGTVLLAWHSYSNLTGQHWTLTTASVGGVSGYLFEDDLNTAEVMDENTPNGAVQLWHSLTGPNQLWIAGGTSISGAYTLRNGATGGCLTDNGLQYAVSVTACTGNVAQIWYLP